MTLAPGAFVRDDVFRFGKIGCPRVLGSAQVGDVNQNSVSRCVMSVAGVIVRCVTREIPGERVDPGARTDQVLGAV